MTTTCTDRGECSDLPLCSGLMDLISKSHTAHSTNAILRALAAVARQRHVKQYKQKLLEKFDLLAPKPTLN